VEKVFLNDRIIDAAEAHIPANDAGFLYGAGLFETMRALNGVVFALNEHLDRLFSSAQALSIRNTYSKEYITDAVYQTLKANDFTDARLRLTLTSGPMSLEEDARPTVVITATRFTPYPAEYSKNGVLVVLSPFKQNVHDPTSGHKTTCYFPRIRALDEARKKRAAEALWFTIDNRLAEGCISNVFLVKNSGLYTPPVQTPVLPGIARKTVLQIAAEDSISVTEKDLHISDVLEADEIFLTNVIMQILPVSRVEQHTVGQGKVGEITKRLRERFDQYVKQECGAAK